jgi:hypothetical protein
MIEMAKINWLTAEEVVSVLTANGYAARIDGAAIYATVETEPRRIDEAVPSTAPGLAEWLGKRQPATVKARPIIDGMVLTGAEVAELPEFADGDGTTLEFLGANGVPMPGFKPYEIWRLHLSAKDRKRYA